MDAIAGRRGEPRFCSTGGRPPVTPRNILDCSAYDIRGGVRRRGAQALEVADALAKTLVALDSCVSPDRTLLRGGAARSSEAINVSECDVSAC